MHVLGLANASFLLRSWMLALSAMAARTRCLICDAAMMATLKRIICQLRPEAASLLVAAYTISPRPEKVLSRTPRVPPGVAQASTAITAIITPMARRADIVDQHYHRFDTQFHISRYSNTVLFASD